ncbi:MAG: LLM class flavin-dependent oxidoreductase [Halobacteriota archaeon]
MKTKLGFFPNIGRYQPTEALNYAVEAEKIGFDSIWVDDHFSASPTFSESAFAWSWMGSALQATERVFFSTAVTAPIMRYNPAIVAQAFATMGVMYPGRVGIGVGIGEELNEVCVVGCEWPRPRERLKMLVEALSVMNDLWTSDDPVSFTGKYYQLIDAELVTKPEDKIPLYFSGMGPKASKMAGFYGDHLITMVTDPQQVHKIVFPNFEAGAKEAGKDPKKMERAVFLMYLYDPDNLLDPTMFEMPEDFTMEDLKMDAVSEVLIGHTAEDFIRRIEELQAIGFDHIIFGNMSMDGDLGVKVFEDILPHVT